MATEETTTETSDKRIKPHHLALGLGIGVGTFAALSGIAPLITHWHDDSPITREVFYNIPSPVKLGFYIVIPVVIIYGAYMFSLRMKNWERGQPDKRATTTKNVKTRAENYRSGVYMQTLLRDPAAGVMHSFIYFSFLVLLAVTTILEINHQVPESWKFLHGTTYQAYSLVGDVAGIFLFVGVTWAIVRRYVFRPYRIRIKTKSDHWLGLGTLWLLAVTGFLAEGWRIALEGTPSFEQWSIVGYPIAQLIDGMSVDSLSNGHQAWWLLHVAAFVVFLVILPVTMMRHMFTSPLNMYLRDKERPKGAMRPMPNLMETELENFGASTVEDFTWKQLMDTDACTMCGRCTSVCPAHATGKPLDPREIVLKVGEVMAASGTPAVSPPISTVPDIIIESNSVFDRITPEEVWSCTSCKACDEICPVNIEILDKILDMRRYLTLMEASFPSELGSAFNGMENQGNPWGMSQSDRAAWTAKVDDVPIVDGSGDFDHEFLYWVGCAGSFDDKNQKVTQAMAKLMQRAEIDFAILGPSENCTGDSARRAGNEYIFQMLAMQNIEMMNGMGVKKIITQCPHCFNTLMNEYPQLGGNYEVVHHSQFLEWLIDQGKLDLSEAKLEERVVYHDSCYLGRHNDVYMAPRNVIGSLAGIEIVEASANGTKGMCCGAGGARMWMEETIGTKVNDARSEQLLDTGAERVATACPFCYIMIDDGVKGLGKGDDVQVADIAMHLLEALEAGEAKGVGGVLETTQD
jgi:Fe-S oxidoreductase/nitrate reductase gamma subunit